LIFPLLRLCGLDMPIPRVPGEVPNVPNKEGGLLYDVSPY